MSANSWPSILHTPRIRHESTALRTRGRTAGSGTVAGCAPRKRSQHSSTNVFTGFLQRQRPSMVPNPWILPMATSSEDRGRDGR